MLLKNQDMENNLDLVGNKIDEEQASHYFSNPSSRR